MRELVSQTEIKLEVVEQQKQQQPLKPHCSTVYILEPESVQHYNQHVQLSNEYGKTSTCLELKQVLEKIGYQKVEIVRITLNNYKQVFSEFTGDFTVFNLCDGCETDGYPGISLLREMEKRKMAYTGASEYFYQITTSKPELKKKLLLDNVPTSEFVEITSETTTAEIDALGYYPLIVKPSVSYASLSISEKSVVHSAQEALAQAQLVKGVDQGVFVEKFLAGREFTALVTGSLEDGIQVYPVAERVFHSRLEKYERILAFEKYWAGYGIDGSTPSAEDIKNNQIYWYEKAPADFQPILQDLAKRAYISLNGSGYGRTDQMESKNAFVLEVNANCGLSFNPNEFTSTMGEILRISNLSVYEFANDLIQYSIERRNRLSKLNI